MNKDTTIYADKDSGAHLGAFVGDHEPPPNSMVVPFAPADARQIWLGSDYSAIPLTMQDYDNALMGLYDAIAQGMGYRSWETCSLRAHRPGPFEAEGTAFYDWMEACNVKGYEILGSVNSGRREQPTIEQFLAEMPEFVRPSV